MKLLSLEAFFTGNDHFTHQHEEEEEGDMMEKTFCLPNLAQTHLLVGS